MKVLVMGSLGYFGEVIVCMFVFLYSVCSFDILILEFILYVGLVVDRLFVVECVWGVDVIVYCVIFYKFYVVIYSI